MYRTQTYNEITQNSVDQRLQNKLQRNQNSVDWGLGAVGQGASRVNELLVVSLTIVQGEMPSGVNDQTVLISAPPPIVASNRPARRIRSGGAIRQRSDGLRCQENKEEVTEALPAEKELSSAAAGYKDPKDLPSPKTEPPAKL